MARILRHGTESTDQLVAVIGLLTRALEAEARHHQTKVPGGGAGLIEGLNMRLNLDERVRGLVEEAERRLARLWVEDEVKEFGR